MSFVNSDGMLISDKVILRRFNATEHGDLHGVQAFIGYFAKASSAVWE